ncbi:hypothetical protein N431DRAFT_394851 [Stipitochalara longipes BDJ]|nr:hypothetical protein N431DRAFT_394851 [Stipitochalara longipes BDJ]
MALPSSASSSSLEDNLALPEYAQSFLPDLELPTLVLISHGHSPPLNPSPQLRFDVRSLPNPPKHIRDTHNGTSKRLQEWMLTDAKFLTRRDEIKSEIEAAMTTMTAESERRDTLKSGSQQNNTATEDRKPFAETDQQVNAGETNDEGGRADRESIDNDDSTSRDQANALRVGIFCAMGKHRSVAMVEELAKRSWPGWHVEVQHRDISKNRGAEKKKLRGQRSRGSRSGATPTHLDDSDFE